MTGESLPDRYLCSPLQRGAWLLEREFLILTAYPGTGLRAPLRLRLRKAWFTQVQGADQRLAFQKLTGGRRDGVHLQPR